MLWRVNVRNDISDLLDFIGQNDVWRDRLQDVIAEHLMPALEEFEIDNSDLLELLGEPWPGVLWGCGFEDFLGRRYSEDNIVDLYLKRRGWNETALNRDYFAALRDTPVSLYEVTEVKQGRSMVLQNLLGSASMRLLCCCYEVARLLLCDCYAVVFRLLCSCYAVAMRLLCRICPICAICPICLRC